jgi:hypothetical protein
MLFYVGDVSVAIDGFIGNQVGLAFSLKLTDAITISIL